MSQSTEQSTIVIIGGVAGGASAATRARRMNEHARIIMLEKDEHVSFANCGLPYHIGGEIAEREKLLLVGLDVFEKNFNIEVRTRCEAMSIDRTNKTLAIHDHRTGQEESLDYDKLILAPGASPIVPPMDGTDADNVFTLRNVADTDRITSFMNEHAPRRAVVVGAGYIGLEMVEQLHRRGLDVTLVELQDQVLPLLDPEMAQMLKRELDRNDVAMHLGVRAERFEAASGRVSKVVLSDGTELDADMVILGIGVRPNTSLATDAGLDLGETRGIRVNEYLQTSDPDIYAVGDAVEYHFGPAGKDMRIALAGPANRSGRLAGQHAATGSSDPMAPVSGTSVVRVFELTAGMTGLSAGLADRLGIAYKQLFAISNHHVGYYPGASPIFMKLLYDGQTGKVLGTQMVGKAGVDKRIDVIATVMAMGGTVRDLTRLDLAYAPPFGAAKDPVHMLGFVACNQMDGLVNLVPADADLDGYQVVDIRSEADIKSTPLVGVDNVINIPLPKLRDRLDELDASKPTLISCNSGLNSYTAARILMQRGFENVVDLSGSAKFRQLAKADQTKEQAG